MALHRPSRAPRRCSCPCRCRFRSPPNGRSTSASLYSTGEAKFVAASGSVPATAKLDGIGDVRLRLSGKLSGDALVATFGANLPTGVRDLDDEQIAALGVLAAPALGIYLPAISSGPSETHRTRIGAPSRRSVVRVRNLVRSDGRVLAGRCALERTVVAEVRSGRRDSPLARRRSFDWRAFAQHHRRRRRLHRRQARRVWHRSRLERQARADRWRRRGVSHRVTIAQGPGDLSVRSNARLVQSRRPDRRRKQRELSLGRRTRRRAVEPLG